jgi:hypothetical protein
MARVLPLLLLATISHALLFPSAHHHNENVHCTSLADFTEYCVYRDACYSRGTVIVKGPTPAELDAGEYIDPYMHLERTPPLGHEQLLIPWRSFLRVSVCTELPPYNQTMPGRSLLLKFESDASNVYHVMSKVLAGFAALRRPNGEVRMPDRVILLRVRYSLGDWELPFLLAVFKGGVSFVFLEDLPETVHFEEVIVPGTSLFLFEGVARANAFRLHMFGAPTAPAPTQITVIQRQSTRMILNMDELIADALVPLERHFEVVVMENLAFAEQVKLMARTRILVAVHGAGLANCIFMRAGGAVVELFPHSYIYHLYRDIAILSGQTHLFYETPYNHTEYGKRRPLPLPDVSSAECLPDSDCAWVTKNANIRVEVAKVRELITMAVSLVRRH